MKKIEMQIKNNLTFEQGCENYLQDCRARNLRQGTLKHYNEAIRNLYKYIIPNTLICDINKSTVDSLVIVLRDNDNINDMTLSTYLCDFRTLLHYFMRCEYIPTFKIAIPKSNKQPIETYSDDDLKKLLKKPNIKKCDFSEYKNWVIVNFLLSVGVRQHSLINIKIRDIDFDNQVVNVNVTKNRKPLIIPLNQDIVKILIEYLTYRKGIQDDYLFCNSYGKQLVKSTVYHGLYQYNLRRGVNKTGMHRFRHTFAKKWILLGGNIVTLQKILGHSSLLITENYLNMLTSDIKKDIDKFNILQEFSQTYINMK